MPLLAVEHGLTARDILDGIQQLQRQQVHLHLRERAARLERDGGARVRLLVRELAWQCQEGKKKFLVLNFDRFTNAENVFTAGATF